MLRHKAGKERVLFHYNGHGVPRPTAEGEVWVFNYNSAHYIPLSIYDLQTWIGAPGIFIYDCSYAGIIVQSFEKFAELHEVEKVQQIQQQGKTSELPSPPNLQFNCIQLAACSDTEELPMRPDLPADLFTSCLTDPIKMALWWFVTEHHGCLASNLTIDMLDKIPGQITNRSTMLGELNWIFTATTDTIAWNILPREMFKKYFRHDQLVASLFRYMA